MAWKWAQAILVIAFLVSAQHTVAAADLSASPASGLAPVFLPLRVQGNHIVDLLGQPVVLRGVHRMGFEYACVQGKGLFDGAPLDQASVDGIKSWKSNVVRLGLNEHCWLGIEGTPSGETYRQGIENYVNLLIANNVYVILDLHWSAAAGQTATRQDPMPNTSYSVDLWTSVANRFKSEPRVMFDLFNEPFPNNNADDEALNYANAPALWQCWRDGSAGGTCSGPMATTAVGMQSLVSAVRATGATNVILLGGIGWAGTLYSNATHNWLTWAPVDPLRNLVASVHVYQNTWCLGVACYDREVAPVAAQVPVLGGEIGNDQCDAAMLNTLMGWLDGRQSGYVAWVWNAGNSAPCSATKLILDYAGTPTQYGAIYKNHLAALP